MSEVQYGGYIDPRGHRVVERNGRYLILGPSLRLARYSPNVWDWGCKGAGAKQLALALLQDATGDNVLAEKECSRYLEEVVSKWPKLGSWATSKAEILAWLRPPEVKTSLPKPMEVIPMEPAPMEYVPPKRGKKE